MFDPLSLVVVGATFLLAGTVKGVIGLGLPTVSLGLLTATLGLPAAMAILVLPSLVTNLWQAFANGPTAPLLRRLWPFFLLAAVTVPIGATALTRVNLGILSALLGLLLILYGATALAGLRPIIATRQTRWAGPLLGAVNGVLTGMTGSFVVPGVMYLQAVGLARDELVKAMGLLFSVSTVALAAALGGNALLTGEHMVTSALAIIPALVGMAIGQRLRRRLPEATFRRLFFSALIALGVVIILRATTG